MVKFKPSKGFFQESDVILGVEQSIPPFDRAADKQKLARPPMNKGCVAPMGEAE